jgi:hypothetical protein
MQPHIEGLTRQEIDRIRMLLHWFAYDKGRSPVTRQACAKLDAALARLHNYECESVILQRI